MAEVQRPGGSRADFYPSPLYEGGVEAPRPKNAFARMGYAELRRSIVEHFERRVADAAESGEERIAVRTRARAYSWETLNEAANRIAHALLQKRGAQAEPVVLLLGQGFAAIAATLGILKAGKFYVPLDETFTAENLRPMMEDAGAAVVIADEKRAEVAQEAAGRERRVMLVEEMGERQPRTNPGMRVAPEANAYIFYTSGSTGKAKGVVDTHRNVLHNVLRYTNQLQIGREDRLLLVQSPSFSGTVSSLFSALVNGATICPFDLREHAPVELAEFVVREGVTIYHSVPAIFRSFLGGKRKFSRVRVVRLEGDGAARMDLELFRAHFDRECVLANGLGATETGLVRQCFLGPGTRITGGTVPIGGAVQDMEILLLDEKGGEVKAGEVGEIAVRSRYLAKGYWRNEELTSEKFVKDARDPEMRVYRTGDLGRMRAGACLEHLGRKDFRIKVRGQTVEAGEVESRLQEMREVRQAAVMTRVDAKGSEHLTAYVAVGGTEPVLAGNLRRHLAKTLPAHMVPSRYVFLAALPVTASGKVDRKALGEMKDEPEAERGSYEAPRNETERRLARVWEEVLGVKRVGVDENFFDLGGHSLLAGRMFALVAREFGVKLPLSAVLSAPTVAELAAVVEKGAEETARPRALVAIQPRGMRTPLFVVHGHSGEVLIFRELAKELGEEQPFYGLESLRGADVPKTVAGMASEYLREVRRVQKRGPYAIGGYCLGGAVAFEMAQQLRAAGEEVRLLVLLDSDFPGARVEASFRATLREHLRRMREMRLGEAPGYLLKRAAGAVRMAGRRAGMTAKSVAWRGAAKIYGIGGRALPEFLQAPGELNRLAVESYRPKMYDGQVLHVMSEEEAIGKRTDVRFGWQAVVKKKVAVWKVPGDVYYMMRQPSVVFVAEAVEQWLGGGEVNVLVRVGKREWLKSEVAGDD